MNGKKWLILVFALLFLFLFVVGCCLTFFLPLKFLALYFLFVVLFLAFVGVFLFVRVQINLEAVKFRLKGIELGNEKIVHSEDLNNLQQMKDVYKAPKFLKKLSGSFWGITTFYNPVNYKNKYKNYMLFREKSKEQGLKLLTVELAFGNKPFELKKTDAEIVVRIRGNESNILWQKERMLNIGLKHLPKDCDKVAWLDCDIIFKNNDWIKDSSNLLEKYIVLQLFSQSARLSKNVLDLTDEQFQKLKIGPHDGSRVHGIVYGVSKFGTRVIGSDFLKQGTQGFAWAARRAVLDKIHFYDKGIVYGGDNMMNRGFYGIIYKNDPPLSKKENLTLDKLGAHTSISGKNEISPNKWDVGPPTSRKGNDDLNKWVKLAFAEVKGSVYFEKGKLLHIWHGDQKNRLYGKKNKIFERFFRTFDPSKDIALDKNHLWKWTSNNKGVQEDIKEYFSIRGEEGYHPLKSPNLIISKIKEKHFKLIKKLKI